MKLGTSQQLEFEMASSNNNKEVVVDFPTWIRVFNDGTVERLRNFPIVPPSLDDPITGVSSKDVTISHNPSVSARIYLPKVETDKVPIYVYFHGGGFFCESAFSKLFHDHFIKLVPQANVIVVSVEYRLAPENPLPTGYDDCWAALQWVASHSIKSPNNTEQWLIDHGDFNKVFIGGDSSGGNIVHNIAMRAGTEPLPGNVKILGAVLVHPYFYGSHPIGSEPVTERDQNFFNLVWKFVYPSAPGGVDNPMINPVAPGAPSLAGLACSSIIVFVAGKDGLRDRGVSYYEAVKKSGWQGKIEFFEEKEEDHDYHLLIPESETAIKMTKRIASFLLEY